MTKIHLSLCAYQINVSTVEQATVDHCLFLSTVYMYSIMLWFFGCLIYSYSIVPTVASTMNFLTQSRLLLIVFTYIVVKGQYGYNSHFVLFSNV